MKRLLINSKKLNLILLFLCLFSSNYSYLIASTITPPIPTNSLPSSTTSQDKKQTPNPPYKDCKCKLPFKRFTMAVETLESENTISKDDAQKIIDALMQISRETLHKVEDKDQAAADMLYKDKILTETQYKRITELLKESSKQR